MAMLYTLVSSAKEWLSEQFAQDSSIENAEAEEAAKDDVLLFIQHLDIYYSSGYEFLLSEFLSED